MPKRSEDELTRQDVIDTVRTVVGLFQRRQKRRLLNEYENEVLEKYDRAVASDRPFTLDARALHRRLEDKHGS